MTAAESPKKDREVRKVNLCQGCFDQMKEKFGESLGFVVPYEVTIVPGEDCDYEITPNGCFQFETKKKNS